MSYLTSISGLLGSGAATPGPAAPSGPLAATDKARAAPPAGTAAPSLGGTAPAEMTRTRERIPPVTAARPTNANATARPGGDGRDQTARLGAAQDTTRDAEARRMEDARAAREEDAAERILLQKELMSRIPVPIEAIPKLAGDLEQVRAIGAVPAEPVPDERGVPTIAP